MNYKKIVASGIAFVMMGMISVQAVSAASIQFSPQTTTVAPNSTFTVDVNVDPDTEQIAGTDIILLFDPQFLEIQSVSSESYFPIVNNVPSTDKVKITAVVNNPGEYKSGVGTVSKVTFKALQEGTTTITVDCNLTDSETSKVVKNDANATNIIDCSANGDHRVTISASAANNGNGSNNGGNSNGNGSNGGNTLPQSGVVEDMLRYASVGGALVVIGALLRVLLRIV